VTRPCCTFVADEQAIQLACFERHLADRPRHPGRRFRLHENHRLEGLLPGVREAARRVLCMNITHGSADRG
jgi:hypothetical protein